MHEYCLNLKTTCDSKIERMYEDFTNRTNELTRKVGVMESQADYKLRLVEEQKKVINEIHEETKLNSYRISEIKGKPIYPHFLQPSTTAVMVIWKFV